MVVFDQADCFTKAVNTAILMNTVAHYIINKHVKSLDFKCGIGIDYGKMLVAKAGAIRRGEETEFYRSLVWLGRPANIASRLTDIANKSIASTSPGKVSEGHHYAILNDKWGWYDYDFASFVSHFKPTYSPSIRHDSEYFRTFIVTKPTSTTTHYPAILMTDSVYEGFKAANPTDLSIKGGWWTTQSVDIPEYAGRVYGGGVYFSTVDQI